MCCSGTYSHAAMLNWCVMQALSNTDLLTETILDDLLLETANELSRLVYSPGIAVSMMVWFVLIQYHPGG